MSFERTNLNEIHHTNDFHEKKLTKRLQHFTNNEMRGNEDLIKFRVSLNNLEGKKSLITIIFRNKFR